ncbi:hypothetical protein PV332_13560 [Streptomyces scabiei]|nr:MULTISPECIES: hypothetical protein [Streptomyces]MDW8476827.1 hypothetical protein [Streptomyces scabiei]MDX2569191.1 hypothetical protein [Streptomyces scabiei]MDX2576493.1 hypothetical protein [Streptomyces scabiei]MDX2630782.1 hypothetical protein [Streptomyces scabiei]MDX2652421.1 hypothetical protein [Streptomyces scabiei]
MDESMVVRCPDCGREHPYAAPAYPCACGTPVAPPLNRRAGATSVTHHTWDEDWISVRCGGCGRTGQWPHPELGCACGTVLRVPVAGTPAARKPGSASGPAGAPAGPRADFRPLTIRTARDAVTAVALYLRWLGYRDVRRADQRQPSGIGLAARGVLAQVDPSVRPACARDVECLWLTAMTESAGCAYFSLAGYTDDARDRADGLGVCLFVLDLTGTPQPVNGAATELVAPGAGA